MLPALPISVFLAMYFLRAFFKPGKTAMHTASFATAIVLALSTIVSYTSLQRDAFPLFATHVLQSEEEAVKKYILEKEYDSKIALVGFHGYNFIKEAKGGREFVHSINLDLDLIRKNTRGKELFIVVPKPAGLAAFDDINIEYPDLYRRGETFIGSPGQQAHFMSEDPIFPNWRVYHVVQPHRDDTIFGEKRSAQRGS